MGDEFCCVAAVIFRGQYTLSTFTVTVILLPLQTHSHGAFSKPGSSPNSMGRWGVPPSIREIRIPFHFQPTDHISALQNVTHPYSSSFSQPPTPSPSTAQEPTVSMISRPELGIRLFTDSIPSLGIHIFYDCFIPRLHIINNKKNSEHFQVKQCFSAFWFGGGGRFSSGGFKWKFFILLNMMGFCVSLPDSLLEF